VSATHALLVFDSIHDVLAAEATLKAQGLWCDLVPTPKAISSDCGMCVRVRLADRPALLALRERGLLPWRQEAADA